MAKQTKCGEWLMTRTDDGMVSVEHKGEHVATITEDQARSLAMGLLDTSVPGNELRETMRIFGLAFPRAAS